MITELRAFYGLQPAPPPDLFQFCVWEILAERTLPARRDLAWQALKRIPALTPDALFRAPANELLAALALAGARRDERLERLRETAAEFRRHHELLRPDRLRSVPLMMAARALRQLSQVPREARARAHLFVLDARIVPFDEEMRRVVSRLTDDGTRRSRKVAKQWLLAQDLDESGLHDTVVYLRHHALLTCGERAPHCGVCPLQSTCGFARRSVQ